MLRRQGVRSKARGMQTRRRLSDSYLDDASEGRIAIWMTLLTGGGLAAGTANRYSTANRSSTANRHPLQQTL